MVKDLIKVLVVDDSLLMRKLVTDVLNKDPRIDVVGVAMDGDFALMKINRLLPDVIVLDINMPRMDGLSALKIINSQYRIPTVVLSAFTREGAYTTLQALKYGAIDFVCKPDEGSVTANQEYLRRNLIAKIKIANQSSTGKLSNLFAPKEDAESLPTSKIVETLPTEIATLQDLNGSAQEEKLRCLNTSFPENLPKIVAIGASTGGTLAIEKILQPIPADFSAGIVVVQHMPKEFTAVFAESLDNNINLSVCEAGDGEEILPGKVYIAPGDAHMEVKRINTRYFVQLNYNSSPVNGLRPSVDVLFYSVAVAAGKKAIGIILTGMGKDGAFGVRALKKANGHIVAQNEKTCVIFGMPKEAIKTGAVDQILAIQDIPLWIMHQAGNTCSPSFQSINHEPDKKY